ncbi:small subunit rRNA maturation protein TSR4 ASCRUDRAFT_10283 [Ascoidea rubescens DSM 1968]|uniref:Programmed cell death protein 2 C-terminal domain-containing protein n=1 Tax=Ascoidea rubescens DSM 1968 TaxID=1344418 RepID=A0A1D2V9Z6_9ASCO|nr:hypothetical protein ASCRUDRAFT_10283 [Ascoidea rubescens DSM 1968]ODV58472.1 hypothetical protein ASCRUDRAFT_10283 [Ascoidea rubescens DSM 1968]
MSQEIEIYEENYSSDDANIFQDITPRKSKVTLGLIDIPFSQTDDRPTIEDSFVGGHPIWLNDSPPSDNLLLCKNCSNPMNLLLQAFAPLENTSYDRVIYVFICLKSSCKRKVNSVKAIRGICKDPVKMKKIDDELSLDKKSDDLSAQLFNTNINTNNTSNPFASSNPFSTSNPFVSSTANPFDPQVKENLGANTNHKITISNSSDKINKNSWSNVVSKTTELIKPKKIVKSNIILPSFPGYFIYIQREIFKKTKNDQLLKNIHYDESLLDNEINSIKNSVSRMNLNHKNNNKYKKNNKNNNQIENLKSESVSKALNDKSFQFFLEITEHNPNQILRYDLNGSPLLFTSNDAVYKTISDDLIPRPSFNLSSKRRFELQLMPKLIIDLEANLNSDQVIMNGMEWGSIFVYSDIEDYINDHDLDENHTGYIEEWCGVQWDDELHL